MGRVFSQAVVGYKQGESLSPNHRPQKGEILALLLDIIGTNETKAFVSATPEKDKNMFSALFRRQLSGHTSKVWSHSLRAEN